MPRLRKSACTVAVMMITLGLAGLPAAGTAATDESYPRILAVDSSHLPRVELEAVVPPLLAGRTLPAGAFSVVESGRPVPVSTAVHLPATDLRLMLVLDTAVKADVLAAIQGAVRDFVLQLPDQARVGLVAANPAPVVLSPAGTDRAATIGALAGLRARSSGAGDDTAALLQLAMTHLPAGTGSAAVVMVDEHPVTTTVPSAVHRAAAAGDVLVYQIVLGAPPAGYLGGLPALTGGRILPVSRPGRLLSAYDLVVSELWGRYRLAYSTTVGGSHPADLTVSSTGITGTTRFVVDAPAPPRPAPAAGLKGSTRKQTSSRGVRLLAGGVLVLLLIRLAWRVARRA